MFVNTFSVNFAVKMSGQTELMFYLPNSYFY